MDIGTRINVADEALRLQLTPVGVNVGRLGKGIANPLGYRQFILSIYFVVKVAI